MATRGLVKLMGIGRSIAHHRFSIQRLYSVYTPDYLEALKSKIPLHQTLNIQIKSYVYPVLENYQKFIDVLIRNMDMEVEDSWAMPPKCFKIQRFKPNSSAVAVEYNLQEYERNIQISEISSIQYPILLRLLEASLPEGVTLKVDNWNPLLAEKRYVPDTELLNLKDELQTMQKK